MSITDKMIVILDENVMFQMALLGKSGIDLGKIKESINRIQETIEKECKRITDDERYYMQIDTLIKTFMLASNLHLLNDIISEKAKEKGVSKEVIYAESVLESIARLNK